MMILTRIQAWLRGEQQLSIYWVMNVGLFLLVTVLLIGSLLLYQNLTAGEQLNQQNRSWVNQLSERVDVLLNEDIPFRDLISTQRVFVRAVHHEVMRYVTQDAEDSEDLENAMSQMLNQFDSIQQSWPVVLQQELVDQLQRDVESMGDIANDLYDVDSPTQLEELAEESLDFAGYVISDTEEIQKSLNVLNEQSKVQMMQIAGEARLNSDNLSQMLSKSIQRILIGVALTIGLAMLFQLVQSRFIRFRLTRLRQVVEEIEETGELDRRVVGINSGDDLCRVSMAFNGLLDRQQGVINEANQVLQAMSSGDFNQQISSDQKGDFLTLKEGVNGAVIRVGQVINSLGQVMDGISAGDFSIRMDDGVEGEFRHKVDRAMESMEGAIGEIGKVMRAVSEGNFNRSIQLSLQGDLNQLKRDVNQSVLALSQAMAEIVEVAGTQKSGDLSGLIEGEYRGQLNALKEALNSSAENISHTTAEVRSATREIGGRVEELVRGNDNLLQRTSEQSASLEETAASMEEMTATVDQNTRHSTRARELASGTRERVDLAGGVVDEAMQSMSRLNESSQKIGEITSLIDGIAFQTNLLALNAAVEAARAGEHGRGFAVVAGEVRTLAQRAADATQEIKDLAEESITRVGESSEQVGRTSKVFDEIRQEIDEVAEIIREINDATLEQAGGINQVNNAITELDRVNQQNAQLVDESTTASRSVNDQVERLRELMAFFKLER